MRRGITLLEVLIAMFILAIGILSIASLIPAAKFLVRDATHSDRSVSIGLSALAEIQNRNLLDWCASEPLIDADGDGKWTSGETFTDTNGDGVWNEWMSGVILDPLMVANPNNVNNHDVAALAQFPYTSPIGGTPLYGVSPFQRTTPWPHATTVYGSAMHEALARRIFQSTEDVAFTTPDNSALRPFRTHSPGVDGGWGVAGTDDDGDGTTDEPDEAGWINSDDVAQSNGEYSWIASVIPTQVRDDLTKDEYNQIVDAYRVSVAVFYKRDTLLPLAGAEESPSQERMMWADVIGSGIGGGDFRLRADTATAADELKIRPNEWIALIGWRTGLYGATSVSIPGGVTGLNAPFLYWYRVVGAGDVDEAYNVNGTDYVGRDVTLAGPDLVWIDGSGNIQTGSGVDNDDDINTAAVSYDADGDAATGITFQAVLLKDCIGVFERTIRND